jgi:hypothetical protein
MKQFSIHKVNKPMMRPRGNADGADEEMDEGAAGVSSKYMGGEGGDVNMEMSNGAAAGHSSLLTAEE